MSDEIQVTGLEAALNGLTKASHDIELAAKYAIGQVGLTLEREVKLILNNNSHRLVDGRWEPSGHIGGEGTPPNRRSGNLMSSVRTETRDGFGTYEATVFPSMIYARRLEVDYNYPYMRPSADKVRREADRIFINAFKQKWKQ